MGNPVVHFEITHKDAGELQHFYAEAFDWKIDTNNSMGYGIVDTGGEGIAGGVGGVPDESYPGHLTFYIQADDLEETLARIEKLGGERTMGPMDVPGGPTLALFKDPRATWWAWSR